MSPKRLTRDDSREQTKQRLLHAARHLIARKGLSAASVEDMVAAAGYTRGAFYSNFQSKEDLFLELLRRDHAATHAEFGALQDDSMSIGYIQQRVRGLYAQLYRDNESFMNWTEARLLATRNARFRAKLNALLLEKRADVARLIEYFYRRLGTPSPVPPETMAMAFMSLYDGVQLWGLYGPAEMTADRAESILTLFIDSLILLARLQATPRSATSPNGCTHA
jgi:AcrR family transcriptional regulator